MKSLLAALLMLSVSFSALANLLTMVPGKIAGFEQYPSEKRKLLQAFELIEKIINSEEFREKVVSYRGTGQFGGYTSNNKLTNLEIYDFIMQGRELINGEANLGEINFDVQRYSPMFPSAVVGRTYPGVSNRIEVNGQHYRSYSAVHMAANITHEWIHLLGFLHASKDDSHSVPYAVGAIMGELAHKYKSQGFLD